MTPTKDDKGTYFCISFRDVLDVVFGHTPFFSVDRLKFSWVFFGVFIKSLVQFYIDGKAFDSTIFHNFCFSERGQVVTNRFFGLFATLITFILSTSTI